MLHVYSKYSNSSFSNLDTAFGPFNLDGPFFVSVDLSVCNSRTSSPVAN